MADFRRWFTVLAVLALMAGAASAQVGVAAAGGSANNALICNVTGAGIPELRPEGYTELAGDILITCTGGPTQAVGSIIPTTNITVYTEPSSAVITSRLLGSSSTGGPSEALLIIDEAGANVATGAGFNVNPAGPTNWFYGPQAPQSLCQTSQQQGNSGSNGSVCNAYVGTVAGLDSNGHGINYEVAVTSSGGGTPAQNVYQGKVGDFGTNTVTFYNVPVLPPGTTGVTRTFRITNVRVAVVGLAPQSPLQAVVSTSPSAALPVTGTAINIGIVGPYMNAAVKQVKNPFQQCVPATVQLTANLIFTEGFATGFKTRVVPGGAHNNITGDSGGNHQWAAEETNPSTGSSNQNIPGSLYGNFAANSESGFIFTPLSTNNGTNAVNYTAGLADYGTRLKAVFFNIPAGVTLFVSQTSGPVPTSQPVVIGGTSVQPFAVLVAGNTGEATQDSINSSNVPQFGIAGSTYTKNNNTLPWIGSDGIAAVQLSANSATPPAATAVWEVTNANPSAQDVLTFSVYISYTPTAPTATNPYGTPLTVLPTNLPPNDVQLSLAPEPSQGAFSAANSTIGQTPIPRFAVPNIHEGPWTTIQLCQTTLLYPFVTGAAGFDTGIAVANTSWDPFGTVNQSGSCKLYGYGVTVATAGNTPIQTTVTGCDQISNPLPGTNCFPIVPAGQVMSVMASATLTNFQGYVIAVCNFQYAHGYAAVTDLGLRNLWSSYLALELSPVGIGSPRNGVAGIETLAH